MGTHTKGGNGASFIAQGGGFCDEKNKGSVVGPEPTYGAFDMIPHAEEIGLVGDAMGSCGIHDDVETAGGGRIVLVADSVIFRGQGKKLDADARPYEGFTAASYSLEGGSGGYIYVATFNRVNENELGRNRNTISARGGLGIGKYGGGSGGVIVLDDNFYISAYQV